MRIDPGRFYTAVTAVAVAALLAGQFAIHGYFEGRRGHRWTQPITRLTPPLQGMGDDELFGDDSHPKWLPPTLVNAADVPQRDFAQNDGIPDPAGIPQSAGGNRVAMLESTPILRVPGDSASDVQVKPTLRAPAQSAASESTGSHSDCDSGLPNRCDSHPSGPVVPKPQAGASELCAPETLSAPDDAAPIDSDGDRKITRNFIARELPDASSDEQNVWLQELEGLPPGMIQDLLRLRRLIGSNVDIDIRAEATHAAAGPHRGLGIADRFGPNAEPQTALGRFTPVSETDPVAWFESTVAAIEQAQSVILNNIANANSIGFKRSRVIFADLPYERIETGHDDREEREVAFQSVSIGFGSRLAGTQVEHTQGELRQTGRELDIAIEGSGFLQVVDGDEILYTRVGRLCLDADGTLVVAGCDGHRPLEPCCHIPADATAIRIEADGLVRFQSADSAQWHEVGAIQTAGFSNPQELQPLGSGLFDATATTIPRIGRPGEEGRGRIRQGCLEESNTDVAAELAALRRLHEHARAIEEATDVARELSELQARFHRSRSHHIRSVQRDDGHAEPR